MPTLLYFHFWIFPFAFTWGLGAMLLVPYFLPSIIAMIRRSHSTAGIFVLNFFLGWTFIGWIAALVWSITSRNSASPVVINNTYHNNQQYGPPPSYDPPPSYNQPPSYNTGPSRPTHQTTPTIRRTPPTQQGGTGGRQA